MITTKQADKALAIFFKAINKAVVVARQYGDFDTRENEIDAADIASDLKAFYNLNADLQLQEQGITDKTVDYQQFFVKRTILYYKNDTKAITYKIRQNGHLTVDLYQPVNHILNVRLLKYKLPIKTYQTNIGITLTDFIPVLSKIADKETGVIALALVKDQGKLSLVYN